MVTGKGVLQSQLFCVNKHAIPFSVTCEIGFFYLTSEGKEKGLRLILAFWAKKQNFLVLANRFSSCVKTNYRQLAVN